MQRREFVLMTVVGVCLSGWSLEAQAIGVNEADAASDVRLALERGADFAVASLGMTIVTAAVKATSTADAKRIVTGGDTSVTEFFAGKTFQPLRGKFAPTVTHATENVSLAEKYDGVAGSAVLSKVFGRRAGATQGR